jgi:hypothetical protein
MADWHFEVTSAAELDQKIRGEILALDNLGRGDEMHGTVHVTYSDDGVKLAGLLPLLEARGIAFTWHKKSMLK